MGKHKGYQLLSLPSASLTREARLAHANSRATVKVFHVRYKQPGTDKYTTRKLEVGGQPLTDKRKAHTAARNYVADEIDRFRHGGDGTLPQERTLDYWRNAYLVAMEDPVLFGKDIREATIQSNRWALSAALPPYAEMTIAQLCERDEKGRHIWGKRIAREFYKIAKESGLAASTVKMRASTMGTFVKWLGEEALDGSKVWKPEFDVPDLAADCKWALRGVTVKNKPVTYYTAEQAARIVAAARDNFGGKYLMNVLLALTMGLRVAETQRAVWQGVNLDGPGHGTLKFQGKTSKDDEDEVDLSGAVAQLLAATPNTERLGPIGSILPNSQTIWVTIEKVAGIVHVKQDDGWHKLRRTFGTMLVKQGFPIVDVQKRMRHANLKQTSKYVTVTREQLEKSTSQLDAAFGDIMSRAKEA